MLQKVLLVWVLAWTVIAFALMGIDKAKAKRRNPRIPGKLLFLTGIFEQPSLNLHGRLFGPLFINQLRLCKNIFRIFLNSRNSLHHTFLRP